MDLAGHVSFHVQRECCNMLCYVCPMESSSGAIWMEAVNNDRASLLTWGSFWGVFDASRPRLRLLRVRVEEARCVTLEL